LTKKLIVEVALKFLKKLISDTLCGGKKEKENLPLWFRDRNL
jgi:hypothetical protein